ERVIACSGGERDFWGEASTIDIRWLDGARCGETVADNRPSGGLGRRKWHDASGVVLMTPSPPVQRIVRPTLRRGRTMTYTVWLHGQQIGETRFEFRPDRRRHAGTFHPTEFGLTVLPSITAMMPALFEFGDLCRRRGLDTDDQNPESASAALDGL